MSTEGILRDYVPPPDGGTTNFIYNVVVIALALIGVGGLASLVLLVILGKTIPESVVAIVSLAVGAMAGLMAPSPATKTG